MLCEGKATILWGMLNNINSISKALINPSVFLDSGKIEGPVLDSTFPSNFSPWFLTGFIEAEGSSDILLPPRSLFAP